jgi:hypothetical protein
MMSNGVWNKRTNQYEAYCAVTDFFQPKDKKILRITNTTAVDSIPWNTGYDVFSVWSATGTFLYACGGRVFENSTGVWKETRLGYYTSCIRGSAANNVFVVGDFGLIAHFNGNAWQTFFPAPNIGSYNRVAVTNNMMIAVGMTTNGQAIAVVGRRY